VALENLIRHADVEDVKISPSGSHLAIRKLYEGERMLVFMSLSPLKVTGHLRFRGKEEVGDFYWANDERVVAEVISRKAALESPVNYGSIFAINYDGSLGKNIFGYAAGERQVGSRIKKADPTYAHAILVDTLPDNDKEVLISTYPWARDWETHGEVFRLNIYTGVKNRITGLPQIGGRAFTDGKGELLFANGTDRKGNPQLYTKDKTGWQQIKDPTLERGTPVGFDTQTSESYLVLDRKNQTEQLIKFHVESGQQTPVFTHEFTDLNGIIHHPITDKPLGVYMHPDYPKEHFFDEGDGFAPFFRGLKKAFDGYQIAFTSFTKDGSKGILKVYGDRLPGDYFLADMRSKKIDFILSSAKWLDPEKLNPMRAESFTTEDGLRIGIYLTFPKGQTEKLPMVVIPHGGPHARDYWDYDREAQILSQNGYLVLQVNFRGSTGYGDAFFRAGRHQWGGKIQQDIADAANWTVKQGFADSKRICIYGGSFGGYSALMNPIRFSDLYQCAIGYVGVYDLEMMYKKGDIQRRDRGISYLKQTVGEDNDTMRDNSPLYNTEKLSLPLFIVHGEKDERVPVEHAEALLKQLKKDGKSVQTLMVANEGHGFYSEENNALLYGQLLEFLDRHIGVGSVENTGELAEQR
jgi:dienelactone hydrolase